MTDQTSPSGAKPYRWAALFIFAMAASAAIDIFEIVPKPWPRVMMFASLLLMIPMMRSAWAKQKDCGMISPALISYNRRFMIASGLYMVCFLGATSISKTLSDGSELMWIVAIVSILPIMGMIWTMFRYLKEETDEYLRHKAIMASMAGLGLVLTIGTAWGFLEMFKLVPHIWNWWVFPVWALGMGFARCAPKRWFSRGSEAEDS